MMSALPLKADTSRRDLDVCEGPGADVACPFPGVENGVSLSYDASPKPIAAISPLPWAAVVALESISPPTIARLDLTPERVRAPTTGFRMTR
jgi:hypothetical protein